MSGGKVSGGKVSGGKMSGGKVSHYRYSLYHTIYRQITEVNIDTVAIVVKCLVKI